MGTSNLACGCVGKCKGHNDSAPSPAGETASEPDKGRFYPCAHECGKSVEWIEASSQWEHCDGGEYCDMGGESYVTAWPKGFPEPKPVPEPVSTGGLGTCADFPNTPHAKGTCESCDMWTPDAASIAPAAVSDNRRGFELWLSREQWGFVSDGLIEHAATLRKRKGINPESTADETVQQVEAVIQIIGDACPIKYAKPSAEGDGRIVVTDADREETNGDCVGWECITDIEQLRKVLCVVSDERYAAIRQLKEKCHE